jgi:hypothetical protein
MNKFLGLFLLVACTSTTEVACKPHPDFSPVRLENGSPGFLVNCKGMDETTCMSFSTDVCPNGGKFLHRNVSNVPGNLLISCQ